eukprot:ctg_2145.g420
MAFCLVPALSQRRAWHFRGVARRVVRGRARLWCLAEGSDAGARLPDADGGSGDAPAPGRRRRRGHPPTAAAAIGVGDGETVQPKSETDEPGVPQRRRGRRAATPAVDADRSVGDVSASRTSEDEEKQTSPRQRRRRRRQTGRVEATATDATPSESDTGVASSDDATSGAIPQDRDAATTEAPKELTRRRVTTHRIRHADLRNHSAARARAATGKSRGSHLDDPHSHQGSRAAHRPEGPADGVRTAACPFGFLIARRRLAFEGLGGAGGGAGLPGIGADRSRRVVWRHGAAARDEGDQRAHRIPAGADHRQRDVLHECRCGRRPARGQPSDAPTQVPPDCAGQEYAGLPQSGALDDAVALVRSAGARHSEAAVRAQGLAGGASRRPDRHLGMSGRRDTAGAVGQRLRSGQTGGHLVPRHVRRRLLSGATGPRAPGGSRGERWSGAAGRRTGHQAGGHQRLALHLEDGCRRARRPDLHSDGEARLRQEPHALLRPGVLQDGGRDARALSRSPAAGGGGRGAAQHRRGGAQGAAALRIVDRQRGQHPHLHAGAARPERGPAAARHCGARSGAGAPYRIYRRIPRAPRARVTHHQRPGLCVVLSDRARLHRVCARRTHSRRAGSRLGRRLAGGLRAAHYRCGPDRARPALRALSEPGTALDARYRHRL